MATRRVSFWVQVVAMVFVLAQGVPGEDAQWEFDGNLESETGQAPLVELAASPATDPEVTFETMSIDGQDADVAHFSRGTYFEVPHGMPPNGGGSYVNQYTLIMDVLFPDRSPSGGWASLLQTNCCNQNDGDWFVNPDGALGVDGAYGGLVPEGEWHRLALVVDLVAGTLTSYIDGVLAAESAGQELDGRFSLYSPADSDPDPYETFFVFADDSGDNAEGFINSLQFHDLALSAGVIAEIGGPSAAGIPRDVCIFPPAVATRAIATTRTPDETNGDFLPGDLIGVKIVLTDVRSAAPPCTSPAGVVVVETLPVGWEPSEITEGGVHDAGSRTITWTVLGAALAEGKELAYKVTAAATSELGVTFVGSCAESLPGAKASPTRGDSELLSDVPFDACGGIRCWNILGAFRQTFGDNPGDVNLRLDYLTDGEVFETDFTFFPGAQVATAFGGDGVVGAASTGILGGAKGRNPGGVPTVVAWNDRDGMVNLNDDVFGGNPDGVMAYAQATLVNTTGLPLEVFMGISSDDSVQVLLNGEEVWLHSIARAGADACSPQDVSPDGAIFVDTHLLEPGENSLLVKVWEGGGGWNFALRLQDGSGQPLTEGIEVRKLPAGICPVAPVLATRSIEARETALIQCVEKKKWSPGETYNVSIDLSDVRAASGSCSAPTTVEIEETTPPGWTPSAPTGGGAINGQRITWTLTGAAIATAQLGYKVLAAGEVGDAQFSGRISEASSQVQFVVGGDSLLVNPGDFTDRGFLKSWLLLGPYLQPILGGPTPGATAIRRDYMTDGAGIHEQDVAPQGGDTVSTDYNGAARSTGLAAPASAVPINPGGIPTWKTWRDLDDTIDFNDYYGGDLNRVMMYAVTYVRSDRDQVLNVGLGSDDSIQVLLDGQEIHINNIARGHGGQNAIEDVITGVSLTSGVHRLMVKVFEGTADHGFRLRFQDENGEPVTEGIEICLDPECADKAPPEVVFHRGDVDANGELQLTDAVRILGFLFLGGSQPLCIDAGDADDNGQLQLTDAVRILGFLFLGGAPPAAPGPQPNPCGPDPTRDDGLDCVSYLPCG